MAEMRYESIEATSLSSAEAIYKIVSNLNNLSKVENLFPKDKVSDIQFDEDNVSFKVDGLGQKVKISVEERVPNQQVRFVAHTAITDVKLRLTCKEVSQADTRLRITIEADLPMMFRMMLEKQIQEILDNSVRMLAQFPFEQWANEI